MQHGLNSLQPTLWFTKILCIYFWCSIAGKQLQKSFGSLNKEVHVLKQMDNNTHLIKLMDNVDIMTTALSSQKIYLSIRKHNDYKIVWVLKKKPPSVGEW